VRLRFHGIPLLWFLVPCSCQQGAVGVGAAASAALSLSVGNTATAKNDGALSVQVTAASVAASADTRPPGSALSASGTAGSPSSGSSISAAEVSSTDLRVFSFDPIEPCQSCDVASWGFGYARGDILKLTWAGDRLLLVWSEDTQARVALIQVQGAIEELWSESVVRPGSVSLFSDAGQAVVVDAGDGTHWDVMAEGDGFRRTPTPLPANAVVGGVHQGELHFLTDQMRQLRYEVGPFVGPFVTREVFSPGARFADSNPPQVVTYEGEVFGAQIPGGQREELAVPAVYDSTAAPVVAEEGLLLLLREPTSIYTLWWPGGKRQFGRYTGNDSLGCASDSTVYAPDVCASSATQLADTPSTLIRSALFAEERYPVAVDGGTALAAPGAAWLAHLEFSAKNSCIPVTRGGCIETQPCQCGEDFRHSGKLELVLEKVADQTIAHRIQLLEGTDRFSLSSSFLIAARAVERTIWVALASAGGVRVLRVGLPSQ
jgi:hypothetical protein